MSIKIHSPNWNSTTKLLVATFTFMLVGLAVWWFKTLIGIIIIAGIIAYILNPIIFWFEQHTPLRRVVIIGIVYPLFALFVLGLLIAAGFTLYQQAEGLLETVQEIIWAMPDYFDTLKSRPPIEVGSWSFDLNSINLDFEQLLQQLLSTLQPVMGRSAQFIGIAASATFTWFGWTIIIFVISIYFAIDLPHFGDLISHAIYQPAYRRDAEQLMRNMGLIWQGYLRGQTTLAIIMVVVFTVTLQFLGVRFALALGILAGVLDFFPYIGPTIVVTLSTIVAIFQGSNWLGVSQIWFGAIVLLVGLIIQQIEGNWLNPRIVGGALGLHPLLVIIGAIMGSILAGVLGVMLAAPILATVKLFGIYAWRKMFDLDPFPDTKKDTNIIKT